MKRSLDFTKEREANIKELINLLGLVGVYGEIPKALDFSVTFTLWGLKNMEKVTPRLNSPELELYFNSIRKLQKMIEQGEKPEN